MSTPKLVITPKIQSISPRSGKINLDYRLENFTDPAVSSASIEVYFSNELQIDVDAITIGDNTGTVPLGGRITGADTNNADGNGSTGNFVLLTFQNLTTSVTNKSFINIPFVTTNTFDGQAAVNFIARSGSNLTVDPITPVTIDNQLPAIIEVGPGQTYTTIQAAINAASNGDVIRVLSGVYNENVTINKSVTLEGPNKGIKPLIPDINLTDGININQGYRTNPEAWIKGTVTVTADNVTIDGFRLRNENGPLQWTGTPDNFKLLNNYVTGYNANKGPRFGDANSNNPTNVVTGWQIDANYIGGLLGGGGTGGSMYLAGLSNSSINNNTFWRPRAGHLYLASLTNVTIDGNKFFHGLHAGGADFDGFGKFFSGTGYGYGGYGGYGGSYGGGYGRNYWLELKGTNDTVNIKNNSGQFNSGGIQLYGEVNDPFLFNNVTIEKNTFPANNFVNAYTQASTNNLSGLIPAVMATAKVVTGGPSGSNLVIRDNEITMDLAQLKYTTDHKSSLEVRGNFNGVTIEDNTLTPTGTNGGVNLITGLNLYGSLPGLVSVKNNEFFGEGGTHQAASYYGIDVIPTFTDYGTYNSNLNIQNNTIRNWEVGVVLRDAAQITANSITIAGNNFSSNSRNVFDGINPTITTQVLSYPENKLQGATLGTVSASDNLPNTDNVGIRQYSISSGNESGFFSINSSSGQITLTAAGISAAANNFESLPNTFTLGITVTDGGGLTATNTVTLSVNDVNEAPGFANATATFSAAENSTTVGIISAAADPDAGDTLTYTLSGVDVDKFNIDNTTRSLTFKTAPDFEAPGSAAGTNTYSVTVTATDSGGLTATQTVTVNVTNVVEVGNPPVITSSSTFSVVENSTAVGSITATDADANTLTYSISGGADQSLFSINGTTGALSFVTAPNFEVPTDAGINNVYNLQIQVTDGNNTVTQDLIITVTNVNEAPSFANATATFSTAENSTTVGTIAAAIDPDAGDTLTYTLSGADVAKFNIDNTTRSLTFKTAPDFEAPGSAAGTNTYSVTVTAADDGGLTATQTVTVNVTNVVEVGNPPVITSSSTFSVAENSTAVGTITATDADANTLTYSISGGADQSLFTINANTGVLSFVTDPNFELPTDAGINNVYNLQIQVTDGNNPVTQDLIITVTNVNEAPTDLTLSATSIAENQGIGTVVGNFSTTDPDAGNTFTYSLVTGTGSIDNSSFTIVGNQLRTAAAFDFETKNSYSIRVRSTDQGGLSFEKQLTINVTNVNEAPSFANGTTTFSTAENSTTVGTISAAIDPDAGDTLTYTLSGADVAKFNIDNTTRSLTFKTAPDFEAPGSAAGTNTYSVTVTAADDGGLTATQTVTVNVTNVVEVGNPPVITSSSTFSVAENSTAVGTITATDADANTLTYSISGGADQSLFTINANTGVLSFVTDPNFELPTDAGINNVYNLQIQVTDGNNPVTQDLIITVTNVNEAPTDLTLSATSIAENQGIGTVVGNFSTTDPDAGNTFTYSLVTGTGSIDNSSFTIVGNQLRTAAAFDFETKNSYSIRVRSTDQGGLSFEKQLTINVTNVNEAPSFANTTATFSTAENRTTVGIITATDPDAGDTLTYNLSGADADKFNIDNTTRSLTFKTAPDFEAPGSAAGNNTYSVTVTATDGGGLTATQAVTVNVTDVDDTPPDAPQIINFIDNVTPVTGTFGNGITTDDLTPTLNIKAEAGSSVRVFRNGLTYGDATAANTPGDYTFTTANLAPGTYDFTAQATDAAGNVSSLSNPFTLTVGLPGYQRYNFTYSYGNGDSYSGYVYAPVGTYTQGQNIPDSNTNETGQPGSYTIDSFGEITTNISFNNLVYLTSYNDADTGFGSTTNIWPPQGTVSGFSGLGSEYGFAYDPNFFSSDPYFSNFFEADIRSNNVFFEFTYYYGEDTNNDYYKGYGYASRDYINAPGRYLAINSKPNDTGKTGYYQVTSVQNSFDFGLRNINTYIWVNEYFDIQTDQDGIGTGGYGKANYIWSYGGNRGLGSEEGYAYNLGFEGGDNQFNHINSADIATTKTFLSIRNPGNAWLQTRFEGNQGTSTNYTFEVVRQGNLNSALSVNWNTQSFFFPNADGNDFVGSTFPSGTVNFAPGQSTAPLTISVQGDNTREFAEWFQAVINNPDPASISLSQNSAQARILNDDGLFWGWGFGDPHLVTLDGLAYDFMAVGEFVLVETTPGSDNPFQVQVRYEPYPGSEVVSITTRMAVKLGERRIELQLGSDQLLVDGVIVSIDPAEGGVDINGDGNFDIQRRAITNGNEYTITLNDLGEQVRVEIYDAFMDVNVLVAESPTGSTRGFRGLLGNRNNDRTDDLTGRDGTLYSQPVSFENLYGAFANSWRLDAVGTNNGKASLFSYGVGERFGGFDRSNFPQGVIDLNQVPADLLTAARNAAAGISDPTLKDAAIYDYLLTGERSFIAAAEISPDEPKDDTDPSLAPVITSVGVAATPLSITEGNSASQDVTFRVWRTNPSGNLTVDYRLEGSINADDLSPGTPLSGLINFADGETEKLVKVTVLGDTLIETDEQLVMRIETPNIGSVMVAAGQAATTIISDDLPPVTIGVIAGNDILNAAEKAAGAVITGTATGLAQVQVTIAGQRKTVNVIDGNWTANFTPQELPGDGSYTVEAIGIAQSGSQTIPASRTLLLDTTPPNAPVINPVTGDDIINPAERSSGITITGTAEANSRVRLTFGNVTRTVTAINGQWSVNISAGELPSEGILSLLATATDTAGNTSAAIAREVRFNRAPSFANATATFSTAENSTRVEIITAATDPDAGDTLIYTLSGADGDKFNIDSSTRLLSFKTAPNFEAPGSAAGTNAYSVTVTATDGGGLTTTQAITVNVTDVTEVGNPPVITSSSTFSVAENSTAVGTITATDVELSTLNYSISGGADQSLFAIDPTTGVLRFVAAPNFEAPSDVGSDNRYNLQIQVKDSDNNTVTKDLIITVTDVNEAPSFNTPTATFSTAENTILVGSVAATDPDRGDTLTYTLSGADAGKFDIDSTTQFLSFKTAPNFEAPGSAAGNNTYNVTVTARDRAGLTTNQAVTISVTNVNEAPSFANPTATFSRAENTTTVEIITATDPDAGDTLTYTLSGADAGKFNIDSSTRLLSFKTAPNFEVPGSTAGTNAYSVTVTATDSGGLTATQAVTINVTNVDEIGNPPVITSSSTFLVEENSTAVGTIIATDADSNTLTYSISGGADRSLFTINANTGALSFVNAPNFEAPTDVGINNVYNLQIQVTDGNNPVTQDLIITVTNVNEAPSFTNTTATFPVAENSTTVGTIDPATDPDADDTLTYTLSGADGDKFNIDSSILSFKTPPDFEAKGSAAGSNTYSVTVTATDGGGLTTTQAVTVNVTDVPEVGNPPVITSSSTFFVAENSTAVGNIIATDADGNTLTYSISGGADRSLFTINANTGALSFVNAPNFEAPTDVGINNVYNLQIQVTDGNNPVTQDLIINVTNVNETPTDLTLSATTIAENQAIGTVVGNLSTTDPDAGNTFTYSLVTGAGATDNSFFTIDGGQLKTAAAFDFENKNSYSIRVRSTDQGGLSFEKQLTINVTNVNEAPSFANTTATFSTPENSTNVGTISPATDPDAGDILNYTLSGADATKFNFNTITRALSFKTPPNFEAPGSAAGTNTYSLTITATDVRGLNATQTVTVNVTGINEAPSFANPTATFSTAENSTTVGTIAPANDPDAGDTLTYSLSGADAGKFNIDNTTRSLTFKTPPDFEAKGSAAGSNTYSVTVTATDGGGLTTTQAVTVNVTDVPEVGNPPVITSSPTFFVAENSTAVGNIIATDADGNTLTYSISGGADRSLFTINANTGALSFVNAPNFEAPTDVGINNVYNLQIQVTDGNNPVTQDLIINVINVNETPTDLTLSATTIAENQAIGTVVGNFSTTDPDAGNTFSYSLVTGTGATDNSFFTIDGGQLKTAAAFNFETKNSYSIRVRSTDQGGLFFEKQLTIGVTDVNEPPVFSAVSFKVSENSKSVGRISVQNPEPEDVITFALAGVDAKLLSIDSQGNLTFNREPDFEKPEDADKNNIYQVQVTVGDGKTPVIRDIDIKVEDVNEAPTAIGDFLAIVGDTSGSIEPLKNDTDPDSADQLKIIGVTDGKQGKVEIIGNQLKYTLSDAAYIGDDVFSYTISDQGNLTATANVKVNVTGTKVVVNPDVTNVNPGDPLIPSEAGSLSGIVNNVSFNFRAGYNPTQSRDILQRTLGRTDAAFNNLFGLYEIDDATGTVNGIAPGQSGYARAALNRAVSSFAVRAGGSGNGITGNVVVGGDKFYAPFVIANGGNLFGSMQDAINTFFQLNADNSRATAENYTSFPVAYFSFGAANPDGAAHIRSFGNNVFGFEDLPAGVGVNDYDFNDTVFSFG